jgi:hypothetical protein
MLAIFALPLFRGEAKHCMALRQGQGSAGTARAYAG